MASGPLMSSRRFLLFGAFIATGNWGTLSLYGNLTFTGSSMSKLKEKEIEFNKFYFMGFIIL